MSELCGIDLSSIQVSRPATKLIDEEMTGWRDRLRGEVSYMFLEVRYERVRQGLRRFPEGC